MTIKEQKQQDKLSKEIAEYLEDLPEGSFTSCFSIKLKDNTIEVEAKGEVTIITYPGGEPDEILGQADVFLEEISITQDPDADCQISNEMFQRTSKELKQYYEQRNKELHDTHRYGGSRCPVCQRVVCNHIL